MGFSRQEYWSGLPFPSPGDLPDPGIEPRSPTLQADALPSEPPGKSPIYRTRTDKFIGRKSIKFTREAGTELLLNGYRVSVWDDEKALEIV